MNQKVINFVNKLKNSSLINRKVVTFSYSELIVEYVDCLYREGFIQSYEILDNKIIKVLIRIENGRALTSNIRLISSPTKKRFLTLNAIDKMNIKKSELFLSTSNGIYSLSECKRNNINNGGLVVFTC
jgi:ribosomal protein S8